ncbi:MAG: hypothetical protein IT208_00380 [Chthonomonadales bacterium]|nr:hypothetical protein [Chthonomonadales bacterium]
MVQDGEPRVEIEGNDDGDQAPVADLHPRHESWARLSVNRSLLGLIIFLVLAGLFYLWVQTSYGRL